MEGTDAGLIQDLTLCMGEFGGALGVVAGQGKLSVFAR